MGDVLAYFISWTTYGTRLHGDERGSVDRDHNVHGTPVLAPDEPRRQRELARMNHPEFVMSTDARAIVTRAIEDHCAHKGWRIKALNVRTNHVHVVVGAPGVHPDLVMEQFKS